MIDTAIQNICKKLDISYIFATISNGKVILNGTRRFPALIRTFGESITEGKFSNEYTSEILMFFADNIMSVDNIDKTILTTRRMQKLSSNFIDKLRRCGYVCEVSNVRTTIGDFDTKVAGVAMTLKVTYNLCDGC